LTVIYLFLFHWTWLWVNFHRHKALTSLGADIKFPPHKFFCRITSAGVALPNNQIVQTTQLLLFAFYSFHLCR
jgi:hypothetical protein